MELVREAVRSGDRQERLGHLPGRQRQMQADGVKREKQADVEKVTDTQQRAPREHEEGGECREKGVNEERPGELPNHWLQLKSVNVCPETAGLGRS